MSVLKHFEKLASKYDLYKKQNSLYYSKLKSAIANSVPKQAILLDYGCGTGEILNFLKPSIGWGVDISPKMISLARHKFPKYKFSTSPRNIKQKFDYIIMTDVVEHLEEPETDFTHLARLSKPGTKLLVTFVSKTWESLLMFWEKMGWKMPEGPHFPRDSKTIQKWADQEGFELVSSTNIWPASPIPIFAMTFLTFEKKRIRS